MTRIQIFLGVTEDRKEAIYAVLREVEAEGWLGLNSLLYPILLAKSVGLCNSKSGLNCRSAAELEQKFPSLKLISIHF